MLYPLGIAFCCSIGFNWDGCIILPSSFWLSLDSLVLLFTTKLTFCIAKKSAPAQKFVTLLVNTAEVVSTFFFAPFHLIKLLYCGFQILTVPLKASTFHIEYVVFFFCCKVAT